MRCMLFLVAIHALMVMAGKSDRQRVAGMCIGGMCVLCMFFRSRNALMYHGVEGVKRYLEEKGVGVLDIGTAIVVYEGLGFLFMCAFWLGCWFVQPVKCGVLEPLGDVLQGCYGQQGLRNYYQSMVEKMSSKIGGVASRVGIDPTRLTASFAEGAVCRTIMKPVLLPMKLYFAYTLVCMWRDFYLARPNSIDVPLSS